jgi:hypothetical protein
MRCNALRLLFPVCAAWAIALMFGSELFEWIPDARRVPLETLVLGAVVGVCALATTLIARFQPDFLVLPAAVPTGFLLTRALGSALVLTIMLAVLFGAMEFANLRLTGDPTNPQYGVSVAFAIIWYPAALVPALTVLAVWWVARRRAAQ